MKNIIDRVFSKREEPPHRPAATSFVSSDLINSDIENYYHRVISDCLQRMLVPAGSVDLGVRRSRPGPDGLTTFAGYVRILKWDPVVMPVLLQNLPVIDARIRKVVNASVLLEHTRFSGLWFKATSAVEGAPETLVGLPAELILQPGRGPVRA